MVTLPSARRIATPTELALGCMFGLQPALAHTLAAMFAGERVTALRTHVHRIRAALSAEAVDTQGGGYMLTDVGMVECAQAVSDFRNWINERSAA